MTLDQAIEHIRVSLRQEPECLDSFQLTNVLSPDKQLYLYGGGDIGRMVYAELQRLHVAVAGYIDRSGRAQLLPVPFYSLEQMKQRSRQKNVTVLICYMSNCYDDTIADLKSAGIEDIIIPTNFFAQKMIYSEELRNNDKTIRSSQNEILEALSLLEDDESRNVFCGMLRAYITKDFEKNICCCKYDSLNPKTIPEWRCQYNGLIDCGAYVGDTLEEFLRYNKHLDYYAGFEPNKETFDILSSYVKKQKEKLGSAFLYPCGVGAQTEISRFKVMESASSSKMSESGDEMVPVVKIDDVLPIMFPNLKLLLKMDVEGYEAAVLDGAKAFIKENKPDLMVCVYHKVTDLWRLVLEIHQKFPNYRFYLRCYTITGVETILYATYKDVI